MGFENLDFTTLLWHFVRYTADTKSRALIAYITHQQAPHTHTQRATNTHTLLLINDHNWTQTNSSPITLFSFPQKPQQQRSWRKLLARHLFWPFISACDLFFFISTRCADHLTSPATHVLSSPQKRTSHPPLRCYLSPPRSTSTSHPAVLNSSIPAYKKCAGLKSTSSGPADMYSNLVSAEVFALKITERAVCSGSEEKEGGGEDEEEKAKIDEERGGNRGDN